jgi:predicted RNA binding protein YcfA (HicA-like mRNA interferase family)
MLRHPVGWRYADLARILRRSRFVEVSRRGSHRRWRHAGGVSVTLVDHPGEVLAVYVKKVLAAITRAREAE